MKKLGLILVIGLVFACGGKKKQEPTTTGPDQSVSSGSDMGGGPAGEGVECEKEIALVCPDDQIDACLKTPPEGDVHKCVAK